MSAAARDPIDECVHCGFCLPACPTYVSDAQEMDSPRGRIYLMKGLRDGTFAWSESVAAHFDRCLGCMGCVTACPSGVQYDVLIESTRIARERAVPRGAGDALFRAVLFSLLPYPARLRVLRFFLWLYVASGLRSVARAIGAMKRMPRLAQLDALAPDVSWRDVARPALRGGPAEGERRARVGVVAGCVQRVYFGGTNEATVRVLRAEGCDAVVPPQGCCGALSLHAGRGDEARRFAKRLIHAFEHGGEIDVVVANAAGCGSAMKEYPRLFENDAAWRDRARAFAAKVRDVTEFLAALPPRAERAPVPERVAYHDACHLAHAQRVRSEPRRLLASIPGLSLCEIPGADQCCGSAGIYNLVEPERANEIGRRKVDAIVSIRPQAIATANPGCTLQLRALLRARGVELPAFHPIEILDRSISAASRARAAPAPPVVGDELARPLEASGHQLIAKQ